MRRVIGCAMLGGGFALILCCAHEIRQVTYPPDFSYLNSGDITSAMHALAYHSKEIDKSIGDKKGSEAARQKYVIEQLKEMEKVASTLGNTTRGSSHWMISDNLDQFRFSLQRAQAGATHNPPNYFWAGQITGSCMSCHVRTR